MKRPDDFDVIVLGGGAAGMAASLTAARALGQNGRVALLERLDRVGKKLLATGNGRCNFTNMQVTVERYHGRNHIFCYEALQRYHPLSTVQFFRELGVVARVEEHGKVFPFSGQASAVLDGLRLALDQAGVQIITSCPVTQVDKNGAFFYVRGAGQTWRCQRLIVATGGMAAPDLGGHHGGYKLVTAFGHSMVPLFPALVQIKTDNGLTRALKGIKFNGRVSLFDGNDLLDSGSGEILFTDYGLSGPPILQLSRALVDHVFGDMRVVLDFLPEFREDQLRHHLWERRENLAHLTLEYYLAGLVNKKVGQLLLKRRLASPLSRPVVSLTESELAAVAATLKGLSLSVTGTVGWKQAQVTAGGIDTRDFEATTMESKLVDGLYCAGEVLDIDGDCGGYNLQWAWASGRLAGESAAQSLLEVEHAAP